MKRFAGKLAAWQGGLERAGAEAVYASARRAAKIARELAPVDSGELRGKIDAQMLDGACGAVVSRAEHAALVEYGASRTPAQPYMRPMARQMRHEFVREMRRVLREVFV